MGKFSDSRFGSFILGKVTFLFLDEQLHGLVSRSGRCSVKL